MTTDTDKIRASFENDHKNQPICLQKDGDGYYLDTFTIGLYRTYEIAYRRGQRDLIEHMKANNFHSDVDWVDENDRDRITKLYRLPEDAKK